MSMKFGYMKPSLAPTEIATNREIIWAAGFYEGDGCSYRNNTSESITISQKDRWVLEWMRRYFGGQIYTMGAREAWQWGITGARARGFLQTIYELVSPRRQKQIALTMGWTLTSE